VVDALDARTEQQLMSTAEVQGSVAKGFETVRAEFTTTASADEAGAAGAQLAGDEKHCSLGFQAKGSQDRFLSAGAFGHNGSAGSESFADPHSGIAFGYTRRRFCATWSYPEHERLAAAVHRSATAS
jgi:hypothetical protein